MKSEQAAFKERHSDIPDVSAFLKIRPRLHLMLSLPWWYAGNIVHFRRNRRKARKEHPPGPFCLEHARFLAACYSDRRYTDAVLEHINVGIESGDEKKWIQAYLDVGLTLCDLGYSPEGIAYIERAIALEKRPDFKNKYILHLCYRWGHEGRPEKIVDLAKKLTDSEPKNPIARALLVKAYIDKGRLDEEEMDIQELVAQYPEAFGFLLPELHFSSKDFEAASCAFDKYEIYGRLHFWLPEYDYKKAVSYYYSDQHDKCRSQALKIRRRMKWDKFYRLDDIEKAGVQRVPDVDAIIESDEPDNALFDLDKIMHYLRTMRHIARLYVEERWHIILLVVVVLVILFDKIVRSL